MSRLHVLLRSAVTCLALSSVSAAHAQTTELPLCPDEAADVTLDAPTHIRRGESYTLTIDRTDPATAVDLGIVFWSRRDQDSTSAFDLDQIYDASQGETFEVVRASPLKNGAVDIALHWTQDGGTPAACRGLIEINSIPVVAPNAKVGDPDLPRVAGAYRIRYRNDSRRYTWDFHSNCDLFGCGANIRSSGGLRGDFRWVDGVYEMTRTYSAGYCEVQYADGRIAKWRARAERTIKLRPTRSENGKAVRLVGSDRVETWVPNDPGDVCDAPATTVRRVTAEMR